ncbi:hypothetical protein FDZ71_02325, partial [bacterium]
MSFSRRFAAALTALASLLLSQPSFSAVFDPSLKWRTISTEHFFVNYPEKLAPQGFFLAAEAEKIYAATKRSLGLEPASAIEVNIVDDTDLANGWATVLPFNTITLYAVQPESSSSIADYNDWLTLVFAHELRHIFTLGVRRGYSEGLGKIFGEGPLPPLSMSGLGVLSWFFASPPNIFLPDWLHEGEAVNAESELDGAGRRNSTYYEMIYRSAVADSNIPPLDRIIGFYPEFPSFSAPYVFGARLMESIRQNHGESAAGEIFYGHGGRVPYAIDEPPKTFTGLLYPGLYEEMAAGLMAEYGPQIEKLKGEGLTPFKKLTDGGFEAHSPVWLDNERLVYTRRTPTETNRLLLLNTVTGEEEFLAFRPGFSDAPALLPDGSILYTRLEIEKPWAGGLEYGDLYRTTEKGGEERLTRGARLRSVAASADGRVLAGVFVDGPDTRLSSFALENGKCVEKVLLVEAGASYDSPRFSPDAALVVFTRKIRGEKERLALHDLANGKTALLTPPSSRALSPSFSPDGRKILYTSDEGGVFNLQSLETAQKTVTTLTNFTGGAFEAAWRADGKELAFSSFSSRGYDLATIGEGDLRRDAPKRPYATEEITAAVPAPASQQAIDEPYSALRRLPPSFWLPDAVADNSGGAFGAFTAGQDSLSKHIWAASAYWSGGLKRPYGQFLYINDAWYPTFTLAAQKLPWIYAGLLPTPSLDYDYWEENRSVEARAEIDLSRALSGLIVGAGYVFEEVGRLSRVGEDLDGNAALASLPFTGRQSYAFALAAFDSTIPHQTFFTLGPQGGRRVEATCKIRGKETGSEREARELILSDREYIGLPFGCALNLTGL